MDKAVKFADWLRQVKKLSEQEILELTFNPKKYMAMSRKYFKYIEENYQ